MRRSRKAKGRRNESGQPPRKAHNKAPEFLRKALHDSSYIVFDLETTGGNPERNGITEICAILFEQGEVRDTFYSLVNPKIKIPPIVRRMTGITDQMVRNAPTIDAVFPQFKEFLSSHVLVSHNTLGDIKFLRHFSQQTTAHTVDNYFLCTHLLAERLAKDSPDKSLKGLAKYFDIDLAGRLHRAEADAHITLEVFKKLVERLRAQGTNTVADAIRLQGDLDSGMRLGWDVDPELLMDLPASPGVVFLVNRHGKRTFLTSTRSVAEEVKKFQRLDHLPRGLLRQVLNTSKIDFEMLDTHFCATVKEADLLKDEAPLFEPGQWHQRVANFFLIEEKAGVAQVSIAPMRAGALKAYGPLAFHRESFDILKQLAAVFGSKVTRRGLTLNKEASELLSMYLEQKRPTLAGWQAVLGLFLPGRKKKVNALADQYVAIKSLRWPKELRPVTSYTGVVVARGEERHMLYRIENGMAFFEQELKNGLDDFIKKSPEGRALFKSLQRASQTAKTVFSEDDAHLINRTLWWLSTARRREHLEFYSVADLEKLAKNYSIQ